MHHLGFVDPEDLQGGKRRYNCTSGYSDSKLAQVRLLQVLEVIYWGISSWSIKDVVSSLSLAWLRTGIWVLISMWDTEKSKMLWNWWDVWRFCSAICCKNVCQLKQVLTSLLSILGRSKQMWYTSNLFKFPEFHLFSTVRRTASWNKVCLDCGHLSLTVEKHRKHWDGG